MRQNGRILWIARIIALLSVAGLVVLVFYLPLIAAILFVALVTVLAITRGKSEGFWSGVQIVCERDFIWPVTAWPNNAMQQTVEDRKM
jgi:hypothetical protein